MIKCVLSPFPSKRQNYKITVKQTNPRFHYIVHHYIIYSYHYIIIIILIEVVLMFTKPGVYIIELNFCCDISTKFHYSKIQKKVLSSHFLVLIDIIIFIYAYSVYNHFMYIVVLV